MTRSSHVPRLIGMIHLLPLPGAPLFRRSLDEVIERAILDAKALTDAGFDAMLVENYGDVPFRKEQVEPHVVAAMTRIILEIRSAGSPLQIGVQVLRNDARSALSIAHSTGASFIRVNVHCGARLTDQGIVEGHADETLRLRSLLNSDARILADVQVKHSQPLGTSSIEDEAKDCEVRGLADALIVSGSGTGRQTSSEEIRRVKSVVRCPVFVGSGVTAASVADYLAVADGVIVGTAIKKDGLTANAIDPSSAKAFVKQTR